MLRAAAYIRVSTDEQREYSPEAQKKALEKYAKDNDMNLLRIYLDEGISGRRAEKRPAFMEMISDAKNRSFDVILVHKFDRFARSREDSVIYKSLLRKKCGVKVISITESIDDDRISLIVEPILEALAEYYSVNLSQEVKKGMTEKALRGEYQTSAPFGYMWEDGILKINTHEKDYIKYIFGEYIKGTSKKQIAAYLNCLGIKTHRGNPFEVRSIDYILKNPVYIGYTRWTPTGKTVSKRDFSNKNTIVRKGNHTPIITEEIFNRVQTKTAKEMHQQKAISESSHFLKGLVKCSSCGSSLCFTGKSGGFQCIGYNHGLCHISHYISADTLEKAVYNEIYSMLNCNNSKYIKKSSSIDNSTLIKAQKNLEKRLQRLKEGYLEGIFTAEEYQLNETNAKKSLIHITSSLESNSKQIPLTVSDIQIETLSSEQKNNALKTILEKIVFEKKTNTLHFYYL